MKYQGSGANASRSGKSRLSIIGIVGALALTGVAVFYNKKTADNFKLSEDQKPAPGQTLKVRYIKKTKNYSGKKRRANCYIVAPYKSMDGKTIEPGCVKGYHKDAICSMATCE